MKLKIFINLIIFLLAISLIFFIEYPFLYILLIIIIFIVKEMNYSKNILTNLIIVVIIFVVNSFTSISVIVLLLAFLIILLINMIISNLVKKENQDKFIKEEMLIAKKDLTQTDAFSIVVTSPDSDDVIWANEHAYDEFPELLNKPNFSEHASMQEKEFYYFNNKVYDVKISDNIYFIRNITEMERRNKILVERQIIIGILQIDNYNYLKSQIKNSDFLEFEREIQISLIRWFKDKKIHYQKIDQDKYQIMLSQNYLDEQEKSRFLDIGVIVEQLREKNFDSSLSLGISLNYNNVLEIGDKAQEAVELANSRGGAQIVVFDNGKRRLYGGKVSGLKSNAKIRARFVYSTIIKNVQKTNVVYLMTHKNSDYDAITSMLLIKDLIINKVENITVKIMVDQNTNPQLIAKMMEIDENINFSTVVDKTMDNLLIIVDTQSKTFTSHPKLVDEIEEIIVIDHHQTPKEYIGYSLFSWIEPNISSTVELIVEMYMSLNNKINNKKLIKLALMSIITDTGNLNFRTDQYTLHVISYLVSSGVDLLDALEELQLPLDDYKKKQDVLRFVNFNNSFAILEIHQDIDSVLLSIIANELIEIKDIKGSIVINYRESSNDYDVKIRSTNEINSKKLIEEFGGGGHARQGAGILDETNKDLLLNKIKKWEF